MTSAMPIVLKQPESAAFEFRLFIRVSRRPKRITVPVKVFCGFLVALQGILVAASPIERKVILNDGAVISRKRETLSECFRLRIHQSIPLDSPVSTNRKAVAEPESKAEGNKVHKYRILPDPIEDFAHEHFLLWNLLLFGLGFLIAYCR